jgi:undecaprenyl diphosphate synthase
MSAIVMDGNGRWAKKRFMPRFFGHKQGVDALVRTVLACADRGIEYLTVFAFSSENWKRPTEEVSGLMGLVLVAVAKYLAKLSGDGVRIRIVGDRSQVSDKLRDAWEHAESSTRHNTRITLSVAFNYGGRWDIVQACQQAIAAGHRARAARRGQAEQLHGAQLCARSGPLHPHRRRSSHQQFPALAGRPIPSSSSPTVLWPEFGPPTSTRRSTSTPAASAASAPCRPRRIRLERHLAC